MASFETETLINYLKECALKGEVATYREMSKRIYCDVNKQAGNNLQAAIQYCLDNGLNFANIRGVGYQYLPPSKAIDHEDEKLWKKTQSASDRCRRGLKAAAKHRLDEETATKLGVSLFKLEVQEHVNDKILTPESKTKVLDLLKDHTKHQTGKLGLSDSRSMMLDLLDVS